MCHFCITRWTAVTSRMSRQGLKCARSTASRLRAATRARIARWALVTCQAHNEKSKLSLFTMKTKFEKKNKAENDSAAMTHPLNFFYVPIMHEISTSHVFSQAQCPWKQSNEKDSGSYQYYRCTTILWEERRAESGLSSRCFVLTDMSLWLFIGSAPFHAQISKTSF